MPGFHQSPRDVREFRPIGRFGTVSRNGRYRSVSAQNSAPQAAQVDTITIDAVQNSADYTLVVDGATVTITSDASAVNTEIRDALIAALESEPGARGTFVAASATTITATAPWPGVAREITAGTANLSVVTATTADEADPIPFGRVVIRTGNRGPSPAGGDLPAKLPIAADFVAQVDTITIETGAAASFVAWLEANGTTYETDVIAHTTDASTTAAAIAAALGALVPAAIAAVTDATGDVVVTGALGAEFRSGVRASGVLGNATRVATVAASAATSLARKVAGLSARRLDTEPTTYGGGIEVNPLAGFECATICDHVIVERSTSETWSEGDPLFVGTTGTERGRMFNTLAAGRVYVPGIRAQYGTENVGVITLDLGA